MMFRAGLGRFALAILVASVSASSLANRIRLAESTALAALGFIVRGESRAHLQTLQFDHFAARDQIVLSLLDPHRSLDWDELNDVVGRAQGVLRRETAVGRTLVDGETFDLLQPFRYQETSSVLFRRRAFANRLGRRLDAIDHERFAIRVGLTEGIPQAERRAIRAADAHFSELGRSRDARVFPGRLFPTELFALGDEANDLLAVRLMEASGLVLDVDADYVQRAVREIRGFGRRSAERLRDQTLGRHIQSWLGRASDFPRTRVRRGRPGDWIAVDTVFNHLTLAAEIRRARRAPAEGFDLRSTLRIRVSSSDAELLQEQGFELRYVLEFALHAAVRDVYHRMRRMGAPRTDFAFANRVGADLTHAGESARWSRVDGGFEYLISFDQDLDEVMETGPVVQRFRDYVRLIDQIIGHGL